MSFSGGNSNRLLKFSDCRRSDLLRVLGGPEEVRSTQEALELESLCLKLQARREHLALICELSSLDRELSDLALEAPPAPQRPPKPPKPPISKEVAQCKAEKTSSKTWTLQKLLGNAPYDKIETQATFLPGLLAQIQNAGLQAWKHLPQKGAATTSLAKVRQGPDEPYSDFVSRLNDAAKGEM
ncbi:hypothetical protein STEG23_019268 [Scotinomys teguina]